jgi:hypothetical protein
VPHEWPTAQCGTVVALLLPVCMFCCHLMCHPQHAPWATMTPSARTSSRYLGNTRAHLDNVRAFLYLFPMAHKGSQYACFHGAPVRRAMGSGAHTTLRLPSLLARLKAAGHVAASQPPGAEWWGSGATGREAVPEPSRMGSRDSELWDTRRQWMLTPLLVLT